jgi:class 3 adenylate cyclase
MSEIQRRYMTVMFCDVVGSTQLAEQLDPEDFHEILADYQRACTRAIERLDGYPARFIGDGVLAYFGFPKAYEDYAQRGVYAALGILAEMVALNGRLQAARGIELRVRIGLHTGLTVAGRMGPDRHRDELDIVGETPHLASRLQEVAPPDSVVISDETRRLVEGYFETEPLGEHTLKGLSRPIAVYRVLRPTGAIGRLEAASSRRLTPLVGRDQEMLRLQEAWYQVQLGRGAIVHLRGEAGIGKSRLARELLVRVSSDVAAEQTWQCSAHHQTTFLYPVARTLSRMLELDRSLPAAAQVDVLAGAAARAGLEPGGTAPLLADLLSVPGAAPTQLGAREARTALLHALETLLVADSALHPLLLIIEDVHWADPSTVELLDRIVPRLHQLPVMCVLTFRPEFEPPWKLHPSLELDLKRLGDDQVRLMAGGVSETELDEEMLARVQSAAGGVPLFVEEMVKMLELDGLDGGVNAPTPFTVPSTLRGLLMQRLDRLPDYAGVIDVAAVIGREFERPLLAALGPLADSELEAALAQLAAKDVIRPVPGSRSRCEFSHVLLQEAAYERLLRRQRAAIHRRVAESLLGGFSAVAEREPELVAHHFSFAREPGKAARYWHAAGTRALERAAFLEAGEHFRRGVEELDAIEPSDQEGDGDSDNSSGELERVDFLTHRAAALQAGRGYAAAGVGELYAQARAGCERSGIRGPLESVIRGEWMFHLLRSEYDTALQLADEMLAFEGYREDSLAEGHLYKGLTHLYLANFKLARTHLELAIVHHRRPERPDQIYEAQGDTGAASRAYLAMALWNLGEFVECSRRSDESLEVAERVGGPVTRAQAWFMRSVLHFARNEPLEFSRWIEQTRTYSGEQNVGYWRTISALYDGWREARSGKLASGMAKLEACLEAYIASGSRLSLTHFAVLLGDLRLLTGDRAGALAALETGERHLVESNERYSEAEYFAFKGRVLMTGPDPDHDAATAAYEHAAAVAEAQDARLLQLRALTQLLSHQLRIGAPSSAAPALAAVCEQLDSGLAPPDLARARALLGQVSAT